MTIATSFKRRTDAPPVIDIHSLSPASDTRRRSPGNGRLGHGLSGRQKNATEAGAGRFEKRVPDALAAAPEAHESLISRKTGAEVPLTGYPSWLRRQTPLI